MILYFLADWESPKTTERSKARKQIQSSVGRLESFGETEVDTEGSTGEFDGGGKKWLRVVDQILKLGD